MSILTSRAFLRNHKDDIAAMDLFTVPTASLRLLYGFFVIEHGRRHIVHFNATFHPTSPWVIQQLREAFPYDTAPRSSGQNTRTLNGSAVCTLRLGGLLSFYHRGAA